MYIWNKIFKIIFQYIFYFSGKPGIIQSNGSDILRNEAYFIDIALEQRCPNGIT